MTEGYKIGNFVSSLAGHDKGKIYIIVGTDNDNILVADGRIRTVDNPKKKNIKHIQLNKSIDINIEEKLSSGMHITDLDIKMAIKRYIDEI